MTGERTSESAEVTLSGDAAVDRSALELRPGAVLGRFVLLARIGVGGMGVVYAAYDPELDRKVAIKVLHTYDDGFDTSASMEREAMALARLAHPNVVAVHDVGRHGNLTWVAMEFVAGSTLDAWVRERPRSLEEKLAVLSAAGRGLAAAHGAGLVHRDFKPDNVMIGESPLGVDVDGQGAHAIGRVRVMDFGLARAASVADERRGAPAGGALAPEVNHAGAMVGTPAYMAPEQHLGLPVDARSDQFSFCVTAWQVLYGERPFAAAGLVSLSLAVAEGRLRPPPRGSRVPRWLRRALERGLSPDPARRFAAMDELLVGFTRGRERARLRRVAVATAALVVVAATLWGARGFARDREVAACDAAADAVRAIWPGHDGSAQTEVRAALIDEAAPWTVTSFDKLVPVLDAWSDEWFQSRREGCLAAEVEQTMSADRWERARYCLDERKDALEALVRTLGEGGSETVVRAIKAASGLPTVAACEDSQWLAHTSVPPHDEDARAVIAEVRRELARAAALELAGRYAEAAALSDALVGRADALEIPSLGATARLQLGRALDRAGDPNRAAEVLETALHVAVRAGEERLAAEIAANLAFVLGVSLARADEAVAWAKLAEDWIAHLGESDGVLGASLWARLGSVHAERGDYAASRDAHLRSLTIRERWLGPDHPDIAGTLNNLSIAEGALGDSEAALEHGNRAVSLWESTLGPSHPMVALALTNLARTMQERGDVEHAKAALERALAIRIATVGPAHPDTAYTLLNHCNLDVQESREDAAREHCGRALEILERSLGPDHPDNAMVLQNLGLLRRRPGEAAPEELLDRALQIRERALGPDHPAVAESHMLLGKIHLQAGALERAAREYELARSGMERAEGVDSRELVPILLGIGRVELARNRMATARTVLERALALVDAHRISNADADAVRTELARVTRAAADP